MLSPQVTAAHAAAVRWHGRRRCKGNSLCTAPVCAMHPTQLLRKDGSAWVSKYARGGSARKLSARRFYIAVDALQVRAARILLAMHAPLP